jgi:hypothetical protein
MAKPNRNEQTSSLPSTSSPAASTNHGLPAMKPTSSEHGSNGPVEKPKRTWREFFYALRQRIMIEAFRLAILSPLIMLLSPIVYIPLYRASLTDAEFTVDHRERVIKGSGDGQQSYYLVWSREGEVFCVADTWSFLSFDSSDRYGKLREGTHIQASVAGWRVPFLSWYRNIVAIKSTEP